MKTKFSVLGLLLPVVLGGTNVAAGEATFVVTGQERVYAIPRHLEKNYSSIIYPGEVRGDDTGNIAFLLISHDDFPDLRLAQPWEATLLLIWDRDYGANGGMVSAGKKLMDDAEWVGLIDTFHHYRKLLGDWQIDYYLNFGPDEVSGDEPNRYYYVKMTRYEPIEIAGAKKTPGQGCSIHSVHDGIAAQFTIHGSNCEIKNFDLLYAAVTAMFQSWRR